MIFTCPVGASSFPFNHNDTDIRKTWISGQIEPRLLFSGARVLHTTPLRSMACLSVS